MTVASERKPLIHPPRPVSWVVGGVFTIVYVFFLWGGISNLVGVVANFAMYNIAVTGEIWALLLGYAATPVVVFFAALLLGLRLSIVHRVVVYLIGLGVVGVVSLGLLAIA
ncbi:hypothetical protein ACFJGV_05245 [Cnuibacter sp. UC19_7]|uniref:hypothetical protein n=1 Tax=Cnuibacter sp. UC19_7 TaxID=3350166 RepID=UPI00367037C4